MKYKQYNKQKNNTALSSSLFLRVLIWKTYASYPMLLSLEQKTLLEPLGQHFTGLLVFSGFPFDLWSPSLPIQHTEVLPNEVWF